LALKGLIHFFLAGLDVGGPLKDLVARRSGCGGPRRLPSWAHCDGPLIGAWKSTAPILGFIHVKGFRKALAGLQNAFSHRISKAFKGPFKGSLNAARSPFKGN